MIRRHSIFLQFFAIALFSSASLLASHSVRAQTPAKEAVAVDLLINGGTIVTMDGDRTIHENGYIAIKDDTIVSIGLSSTAAYPKGLTAKQTIDAKGKLILPGFINGHTHVPMTLLRGLKDDVTLDDWLRKFIFPAGKNTFSTWVPMRRGSLPRRLICCTGFGLN